MKRLFAIIGIGSLAISGCKEKPPLIQLTEAPPKEETTYVLATVPTTAELHNVLIEDFTGATCVNCPAAHDKIVELENANPGRINVIALYITNYTQTQPPHGAKYDFRTQVATDIQNNVFQALSGMPIGGIDRMPFGSNAAAPLQCATTIWNGSVATQLNVKDSINLDVTSVYDDVNKKAKITATVTYLYPTSEVQNINLAILEDGFVDLQEDNRIEPDYLDTAYHFNSVLRGLVTANPFGDQIASKLPALKEKGLVYQVTYNYDWNAAWNPTNCRIMAFVTKGNAGAGAHVYQSKQCKVKP